MLFHAVQFCVSNMHSNVSTPDRQCFAHQQGCISLQTWGTVRSPWRFWTKCLLFLTVLLCRNIRPICVKCEISGWTGLCFLTDWQQRFQWPSCVSQWHGTVAWHACKGTSSPLTSYSRFLIFSGLHKIQTRLCVLIDKGESQGTWTHKHTHAHEHTSKHTHKYIYLFFFCKAYYNTSWQC